MPQKNELAKLLEERISTTRDLVGKKRDRLAIVSAEANGLMQEIDRAEAVIRQYETTLRIETDGGANRDVPPAAEEVPSESKAQKLLLRLREVDGRPSTSKIVMEFAGQRGDSGFTIGEARDCLEKTGVQHASRVIFTVLQRLESRNPPLLVRRDSRFYVTPEAIR